MRRLAVIPTFALALRIAAASGAPSAPATPAAPSRGPCEELAARMEGHWPDPSTRLTSTHFHERTEALRIAAPGAWSTEILLPPHCEVLGVLHERHGTLSQDFAIHFRLRLPANWNHRF